MLFIILVLFVIIPFRFMVFTLDESETEIFINWVQNQFTNETIDHLPLTYIVTFSISESSDANGHARIRTCS